MIGQNGMQLSRISIDSDVLIWYLRGNADVANQIEGYIASDTIIVASTIVILEVLRGMRSDEILMTRSLLDTLQAIPVDQSVIEEAYRLFGDGRVRGQTLPFNDSIVAATAVIAHAPLFTYNTKDYPKQVLL